MPDLNTLMQQYWSEEKKDGNEGEAIRECLENLSKEFLFNISFLMEERNFIETERYLEKMKRLHYYLTEVERSLNHDISFEQGIYCGEYLSLSKIFEVLVHNRKIELKGQKLAKQAHVKEILQELYRGSELKHSEIAKRIHIDASQLSRILDRLVEAGIVEKYQESKFSFFALTFAGRRFFTENYDSTDADSYSKWAVNPSDSLDETEEISSAARYGEKRDYLEPYGTQYVRNLRKQQYMQKERIPIEKRRA